MHPADIICALSKAEYTQTRVADELGVHASLPGAVIHGNATSYPTAKYISKILNIPIGTLWPDGRYDKSSTRSLARKQRGKAA